MIGPGIKLEKKEDQVPDLTPMQLSELAQAEREQMNKQAEREQMQRSPTAESYPAAVPSGDVRCVRVDAYGRRCTRTWDHVMSSSPCVFAGPAVLQPVVASVDGRWLKRCQHVMKQPDPDAHPDVQCWLEDGHAEDHVFQRVSLFERPSGSGIAPPVVPLGRCEVMGSNDHRCLKNAGHEGDHEYYVPFFIQRDRCVTTDDYGRRCTRSADHSAPGQHSPHVFAGPAVLQPVIYIDNRWQPRCQHVFRQPKTPDAQCWLEADHEGCHLFHRLVEGGIAPLPEPGTIAGTAARIEAADGRCSERDGDILTELEDRISLLEDKIDRAVEKGLGSHADDLRYEMGELIHIANGIKKDRARRLRAEMHAQAGGPAPVADPVSAAAEKLAVEALERACQLLKMLSMFFEPSEVKLLVTPGRAEYVMPKTDELHGALHNAVQLLELARGAEKLASGRGKR